MLEEIDAQDQAGDDVSPRLSVHGQGLCRKSPGPQKKLCEVEEASGQEFTGSRKIQRLGDGNQPPSYGLS